MVAILGGKPITDVLTIKDFKPTIGETVLLLPQTVYDGDTFYGTYFNTKLARFVVDKFRIARIDAAEMKKPAGKTETEAEKTERLRKAIIAKTKLVELIIDKEVFMTTTEIDHYNRPVCEIMVKGGGNKYYNVSDVLLEQGIVEPYNR